MKNQTLWLAQLVAAPFIFFFFLFSFSVFLVFNFINFMF